MESPQRSRSPSPDTNPSPPNSPAKETNYSPPNSPAKETNYSPPNSPVKETNYSPPNSPVKKTNYSPPTSPTPGTSNQKNVVVDTYKDSAIGGGYNNPNAGAIPQYKPTIVVTASREYNFEAEPRQSETVPLLGKSKPPTPKKQLAFNIFMASALVATIALIITLVVLSSNSGATNTSEDAYNTTTTRLLKAVGAPAGNETDSVIPTDTIGTNGTTIIQNGTLVVTQSTVATTLRTTTTVPTTTTPAPTPSTTEPPPDTTIQVEIDQGILQGKKLNSTTGREYLAFLGIPYAAPSNSSNRFQDPKETDIWEGTRDARSFQLSCIHQANGVVVGQEDCLYLNVFTPKNSSELGNSNNNNNGQGGRGGGGRRRNRNRNNFPVIIYVGEVGSSGNTRLADYFMNSNVTLVTFEYRSGLFGSLNLNVTGASGNQGFKDQVMAFQWVRDNIAQFGGNRRKITLLGNGIGSNAISAHLLSSMSSSLFHRAILSSGTVLQPAFFQNQTKIARQGLQLGQALNCTASPSNSTSIDSNNNNTASEVSPTTEVTSNDLLNCFLNKSINELAIATSALQQPWSQYLTLSIDTASDGDIFFTDTPVQLLEAGNFKRLPLIIGTSTNSLPQNGKTKIHVNESDFDLAHFLLLPSSNSTNQILVEVEQFYFNTTNSNGNSTTNSNDTASTQAASIDFKSEVFATNLTNLYYDRYFNHPVAVIAQKQFERNNGTGTTGRGGRGGRGGGGGGFSFADLFSRFQNNGVYLYYLNVSGTGTVNNSNGANVNVTTLNVNVTEDAAVGLGIVSGFSKLILDLWTTFADTGIPTGLPNNMTWTAVNGTAKPLQALSLVYPAPVVAAGSNQTEEGPQMVSFFEERMNFWDKFNLTEIYQ